MYQEVTYIFKMKSKTILVSSGESGSDDEETIDDLVQEACMPLDEVMAKYKVAAGPLLKVMKGEGDKAPSSPMLRARRPCTSSEGAEGPSTSSSSSSAGPSSSNVLGDVLKGDFKVICNVKLNLIQ